MDFQNAMETKRQIKMSTVLLQRFEEVLHFSEEATCRCRVLLSWALEHAEREKRESTKLLCQQRLVYQGYTSIPTEVIIIKKEQIQWPVETNHGTQKGDEKYETNE